MRVKTSSLRRKFIIFVLITIIPIATNSIISFVISKQIINSYDSMLNKMSITKEVKNSLNDSFTNFNKYMIESSAESKEKYEISYDNAMNNLILLEGKSDLHSKYILRDLQNSLRSYRTSGDATIEISSKQSGIDVYYGHYVFTKEIFSYSNIFLTQLSESYLSYNNEIYNKLKEKEKTIYKVLLFYIITALLISILYTLFFLKNILEKLRELVEASKKVSYGDFSFYEGKKTFIYELDILSEAFSTMIHNIKKHINFIKEKAELEMKLRNEEMNLLKYQNALKQSKLKVLQSQINPHFLFNTLNCINQAAIKENAPQTESLITSVSGILRYSLRMMDRNASMEEEITVVKQYMFIQQLRFEDRIKFNLRVRGDLSKVLVPGMTLQPFVENAFIHGIEPKEEGGIINIDILEQGDVCTVLIEDTGCGIDEETLNKIISEDVEPPHTGHTTGMGIRSVVQRLELIYGQKNIFRIESKKDFGTKVYLKIPIKELKDIC
ncbi:histidine kinase [Clostridium sp. PL3]|uniref:Histidine kinase n=1 Tax=Clostridium thailandense TaxID=2794346 RepID=A0A949U3P2_9CLOT|nr:histidine kinase [Clostridium thailandense]MBV7276811.1 histidine kinase [Clostridium thailandense]